MKSNVYGYVRVSTKDQNEARQMIAMQEFGIDESTSFWTSSPVRISTARSIRNSSEG